MQLATIHTAPFALALLTASPMTAQTLAFPGAEGFGRFVSGGRRGDVFIVTNLNDSGAGSLREGVTNRNVTTPRTVVFAVSGTIFLNSPLRITKGNLTIAGQTAPGDGICLANYEMDPGGTDNVIVRFLRSRHGDVSGAEGDAFSCRYASNLIIDHCSFSWSVDETFSTYINNNLTLQWSIVSESLRSSVHSKGNHGYGGIWGGITASYHHNLLAHHDSRNPRFSGAGGHNTANELVDMRNNVIYNWRGNTTYGGEPTDTGLPARHNMVNNTYKPGPATPSGAIRYRIVEPSYNPDSTGPKLSLFHIAGNCTTANETVTADNWSGGVQVVPSSEFPEIRATEPFEVPPVLTQSADESYQLVLDHAGCQLPVRDSIDARIVSEVQNGTFTHRGSVGNLAGIIDSQADVGGWPLLASLPAPTDSDADGMPNNWESARGLDPDNAADRNLTNEEGYTNLELYLNELAAPAFPIPLIGTQPDSQTVAAGDGFTLSVAATGANPISYQWYHGSTLIPGATAASYSVTTSTSADGGDYRAVVSNGYGSATSATASIVLTSVPPSITSEPSSLTVAAGTTASFSVTAAGSPQPTYQWFRGDRALPGESQSTIELDSAALEDAGPYHVEVTNAHGSVTSSVATLGISTGGTSDIFSTTFATDTLQSATPVISPTATNWYVMSSKDARASSIGGSQLDLTMAVTSSGVVESAAPFAIDPAMLADVGKSLRLQVTLATTNVRTLGLGLFHSGGTLPHTGLINAQLTGSSSALATGGTQEWKGYRFHIDGGAATPAVAIESRPAQPGTTNASQSLIVPGTSSSAPTVQSIASAAAPGFTWTDEATFTLVLELKRMAEASIEIKASIHAGTETGSSPPLATATVTTPNITEGFDALAIGYRNLTGGTASRILVTQASVQASDANGVVVTDAYQAFVATHQLDPSTTGVAEADPDSDGVANALEFILGGDPASPGTSVLPALVLDSGWHFRFTRHVDATTVFNLDVMRSSDLIQWQPVAHGIDGITFTGSPFTTTHDQVDVLVPDGTPSPIFLRLEATPKD
jgi:hypothetical protein